jgi:hypothetical protein
MGFDPGQMAFLREARRMARFPVPIPDWAKERIICNGKPVTLEELSRLLPRPYAPPPGWVGHLGPV